MKNAISLETFENFHFRIPQNQDSLEFQEICWDCLVVVETQEKMEDFENFHLLEDVDNFAYSENKLPN